MVPVDHRITRESPSLPNAPVIDGGERAVGDQMRQIKQHQQPVSEAPSIPEDPEAGQYERYAGGSPEAERAIFEKLARDLMRVQLTIKQRSGAANVERTFHAKAILGVDNAKLRFHPDLPDDLRVGFARPDAEYPVIVRLSNASGTRQPDFA